MDVKYLNPERTQELIDETKRRLGTKQDTIQVTTMPTASAALVGKVYQYIGTTSGSYTHNYFYECKADTSTTPATYSWEQVNVQPDGGSGDVSIATPETNGISKPDDLTIFINQEGTLRTKVWAGTLARYVAIKDQIPRDTTIVIVDSDETPEDPYYVNGVKIVSFSTGSWADISAMIDGHDAGKINLYDYWRVGDSRAIHIDAITHRYGGAFIADLAAQDVKYVLVNEGYMGQTGIHYAVKQMTPLNRYGRMHPSASDTYAGSWRDSEMRTDLNNLVYPALETGFKNLLKSFNVITADSNDSLTNQVTTDKMALLAEKEIFGDRTVRCNPVEATALSQMDYYKTYSIDRDTIPTLSEASSVLRSPVRLDNQGVCAVSNNQVATGMLVSHLAYVKPFVCI